MENRDIFRCAIAFLLTTLILAAACAPAPAPTLTYTPVPPSTPTPATKADFESEGREKLKKVPSGYEGANYAIEFDEMERSTSLTCEVHGAELRSGYFDFLWLLRPLGLDFIDDHFEETPHGLSWKGTIEGIPTEIICEFPAQDVPYAAWGEPIGHCHGHVWWPKE